jgi:hypothetical protein
MKQKLPWFLDRELLKKLASFRMEKITGRDKFKYFKEKSIENLIKPSIEINYEIKKYKKYRERINTIFLNQAILTLDKEKFISDILQIAEDSGLLDIGYKIELFDFLEYSQTPAINAWNAQLNYLTLVYLADKEKTLNSKSYKEAYLPKKFEEKVISLMNNFGLEYFWYESIVHLLLTGIWYLPRNSSIIRLKLYEENIENISPTILIEISSHTSKEEINYRWEEIRELRKKIFPTIKERLKTKNIKDPFSYEFKNDLGELADNMTESKKGKSNNKIYLKKLESLGKKIARARNDQREFIENYKMLPRNIRTEIDTLGENCNEYIIF